MRRSNWTIFRGALWVAVLVALSLPTKPLLADTTLDSGTTTVSTGTNFGGRLIVASTGTATMNVVAGGYATNTTGYIGYNAGSKGTVNVSSGTWDNSDSLTVGFNGGTGSLNVAGGSVTSNQLQVGQGNGVGTINVSSGTLNATTFLTLGGTGGGTGTLNVTGGLVGGSGVGNFGNGIYLGRTGSSSGRITITGGTVSTLTDLRIGELGSGTVSITNGYFRANNTYVGSGTTSVGLLSVGTSGTADMRGLLLLGGTSSGAGRGTLTVDGGLIAVRGGSLGAAAGTLGTVTVTSGTWLNNASGIGGAPTANLTIGGSGTGSVTINNGGYVAVSGTFSRGANGTLTLNQGGTLQIGGISDNQNSTRFLVASTGSIGSGTSGVLVGDLNFAGTLKFAQNSSGTSPISTYNGTLSGAGDLVKTGTGTLLLGGNNTYTGGTTLVAGFISLNSANAIGTTGTISFTGGTLQATANNTTDYSARFSDAANQQYKIDSNGENLTLASDLTSVGGTFTKAGAGTVTLTGANTFTSGSVQAGLLQGSATSLATSGTFGVAALTNVVFATGTANENWAGKMFGSGTFSKTGAGTLTLTGSGAGTTGTLLISDGAVRGTTDNLKQNIVNNSQLTFDQTTSGTYAPNISGSGDMLLSNSGTITFTGTTTLAGTATVSSGRLVATKASAMPQSVVNNAAVGFNNATSGTYSGAISGSGLLAKLGAGDMTLTGTHTYSGGTQISAGSLIGDTTSLQGDFAVTGGNLKFNQATSGTFSDVLSGVGNFFKLGAGDLTLTGTNTNAGPWTVSAGRLIGTTSSIRGDITNTAAVVFDQTTSGTYSGNMSGAGTLTKLGSGAVTLSGLSNYSGGTTVSAGSLIGTTNSLKAAITNNAAVTFDQTITGTYAGNMTGSGALTKAGSGTVTLTGANSYSGGTTVAGGSLVGTTSSLQGDILNNAAVTFNQGSDDTYAGNMSGTGSLTKLGNGAVTLSRSNSYSGLTTISAGTVALSGTGSIGTGGLNLGTTGSPGVFDITGLTAGTYSLPATGNLAGVGTLAGSGKSLTVLGPFTPGNSPGTVTLGSGFTLDLSQSGSSVFEITNPAYTAGTYDLVSGSGSVVFGGILNLVFSSGTYAEGTDVLQLFANAGGLSGNFSAVNATGLADGQSATFNAATGFISLVPEPSTCASLLAGLAFGCYTVFRRRRAR